MKLLQIAITLAALLISAVFAGCAREANNDATPPATTGNSSTTTAPI